MIAEKATTKTASINQVPPQLLKYNIIPLKPRSKKYNFKLSCPYPSEPEDYQWKPYQKMAYMRTHLEGYKGNLAVILGDPFGDSVYLTQIDLDDPKYLEFFEDAETLIIKSGKGYHVYIESTKPVGVKKDYPLNDIEIRGHEGSYAVIPPSIHPKTGERYQVYKDNEILKVENAIDWVKERLSSLSNEFKKTNYTNPVKKGLTSEKDRELSEQDIDTILTLLKPYYKENYRNEIVYSLSGWLKKEGILLDSAKLLIERLAKDDEDGLDTRLIVLERTYNNQLGDGEIKGISGVNDAIDKQENDETIARMTKIGLKDIINLPEAYGAITGIMGTDKLVIADPNDKSVKYKNVVIKNDKDYSKETKVIDAFPDNIIVYDSPLEEEPRKFEIIWKSSLRKGTFKTGPDLLEDIKIDLIRDGYVTANRLVNDVLPSMVNTFVKKELAEVKTDIETPGFFYNASDKTIIGVKYDFFKPPNEELLEGLLVLEDLANYYKGNEHKLATIFKWGLIAPFIYSKKQQGSWTPWLYLYGKAKSGKTTLGQMVLYMWGEPTPDSDLTGSGFDTVARVGGKISQSTFPIVVNEPAGAFQRISVVEMIKGAIERITSRGRYEGRRYHNIPSFNPVIFTANQFMPDDDALIRRLWVINFTHSEKKTEDEIKEFEEEWQTKNLKKCKFNALKSITQMVAKEYINDPSLWELDWRELADTIITRLYVDANRKPPQWLYQWSKSETMEDLDEEHREDIRIFLLNEVNRAYGKVQLIDPETGKTVYNEDSYSSKLKKDSDFKEKVWNVANERFIPWMVPFQKEQSRYICLTIGFKKEVHRHLEVCQPLKGIAELMEWPYRQVRLSRVQKVIRINLDKFVSFLYPTEGN